MAWFVGFVTWAVAAALSADKSETLNALVYGLISAACFIAMTLDWEHSHER
jgi:hypothetical protein